MGGWLGECFELSKWEQRPKDWKGLGPLTWMSRSNVRRGSKDASSGGVFARCKEWGAWDGTFTFEGREKGVYMFFIFEGLYKHINSPAIRSFSVHYLAQRDPNFVKYIQDET